MLISTTTSRKNDSKSYLGLKVDDVMVVVDPVCKMKLDERDVKFKSEYKGKMYYFCGLSDKRKFDENPEKYIEP